MNVTLFLSALRQRFTSKPRLALLFCVFVFPLMALALFRVGLQALNAGSVFALILGAGVLGQETSSGVMQLLFARPVRRSEYVVSRWLAVAAGAAALSLAQLALACLIWLWRGPAPEAGDIAINAAQQTLNALGTASVVLFFSSFVSGVADVIALLITQITGQILTGVGTFRGSPALIRTGEEIGRFIAATVPFQKLLGGRDVPWFELVSYLSTVTLCVTVAIWALNRREISYASE